MNIVLIGFMGSGKSSVGRVLAKQKGMYFIDTDSLIESSEGRKIRDVFAENGEGYFRELEKKTFSWLSSCVDNAVISTGGGMPTVIDSFEKLGKTVYLKVDFETLLDRLKAEEFDKRPLFQDIEFAKKIFDSREPIYVDRADITIDANKDFESVVKEVLAIL